MIGETLNPVMIDRTEMKALVNTTNQMLAMNQRKLAVDTMTCYGSSLVNIARTIQDKVLRLIMVFDTIGIDEKIPLTNIIPKLKVTTWLNSEALETFQVCNSTCFRFQAFFDQKFFIADSHRSVDSNFISPFWNCLTKCRPKDPRRILKGKSEDQEPDAIPQEVLQGRCKDQGR